MTETETTLVSIAVYERSCPYDDYDTENGGGMPDDVEPERVDTVEITATDLIENPDVSLNDSIQAALNDLGCGQWDGSDVGYDPDGSHMAFNAEGTITERYAVVTRLA